MRITSIAALLIAATAVSCAPLRTSGTSPKIPEKKQTSLGLYLTAGEAYRKYRKSPDTVKLLDVRTPEEFIFVGHAEMAVNIPLAFQTYRWNAGKGYHDIRPNPEFLDRVREWAKPDDAILVMCRSGDRSAMAVNKLAKDGFTNVWNIYDGMEGDVEKNPASPNAGKRTVNGWKNSGSPWTYQIQPERMRIPKNP